MSEADEMTEAHATSLLGELVCSNSLRSNDPQSAPGDSQKRLSMAGSLTWRLPEASSVPAGSALAVDRGLFGPNISRTGFRHIRTSGSSGKRSMNCLLCLPVIATGPLSSPSMTEALAQLTGSDHLYFYDAIAPIIAAASIDTGKSLQAVPVRKGWR